MGKTIKGRAPAFDVRQFRCKLCGKDVEEGLFEWRRKPQSKKNVCLKCIKKRETAVIEAAERAKKFAYMSKYSQYCCL